MGLGFGSALNAAGRTIYVSDVDFRITPGVIIGLQANPPPPELRPVGIEMAFCQRYYEVSGTTDIFSGDVTSGGTYYATSKFQGAKRAVPTVTIIASSNAGFPSGAPANAGAGTTGFRTSMVANGTAAGGYFQYNWNATAEL
jgi:hypothetical protein